MNWAALAAAIDIEADNLNPQVLNVGDPKPVITSSDVVAAKTLRGIAGGIRTALRWERKSESKEGNGDD